MGVRGVRNDGRQGDAAIGGVGWLRVVEDHIAGMVTGGGLMMGGPIGESHGNIVDKHQQDDGQAHGPPGVPDHSASVFHVWLNQRDDYPTLRPKRSMAPISSVSNSS